MNEHPQSPDSAAGDEPGGPGEPERASDLDPDGERRGDALRTAVERTLAVTADSATETRQRAQDLLDDVVRRGQVARDEVARRSEEATARLAEAIGELRSAQSADGASIEDLAERLAGVERRLAALEARTNPSVEPETTRSEAHQQANSGD